MERLKQQMDFIMEADKLKNINRQTYIADGTRKENDSEHSWHLALMSMLLSEHANEEIDVLKVMSMVLIHDIVEIDAGDTYAYDEEGKATQREREEKAAHRLFNILPKDQAEKCIKLWHEFETNETAEARFATALDHCQPTLLNHLAGGKSWEEHGVKLSQILKRNEETHLGSERIWDYQRDIIEENINKGKIIRDC